MNTIKMTTQTVPLEGDQRKTLIDRIKERTEEQQNGCLHWTGCTNNRGYGVININKRVVLTHRKSYELLVGPIPEGLCVLHRCDVRKCLNPDHLFLGTNKENSEDMVKKGRGNGLRGEHHRSAKLKEHQVLGIRKMHADGGVLQREIAKLFGVNRRTVSGIISRKIWKHIP